MRVALPVSLLVLLVGCATQQAPVAPAGTTLAATDKPAATTLDEARRLGYRIVSEDGRTLYCRDSRDLGSHIRKQTTCLTEEEMVAAREAAQRNFDNMKKFQTPPQGLEGGRGGG
jgi:hypothetical protein